MIEKEDPFLITYDHTEGKKVFLFFGLKSQLENFKANIDKFHEFRLLTDDKDLCLSGISSKKYSLSPLDLFGTPSYGCTEIQYRNKNGTFETING